MKILFVSNGNGEVAIAERIARDLRVLSPALELAHFPLVGESRSNVWHEVGPRALMPSGGLIAMGNVRNIAKDLRGGLIGLTLAQRAFLVRARGTYARLVAVGDVFALLMALAAHAPTTYVGTAKSVRVAPYGAVERMVLRRADGVFVRDEATAQYLQERGVPARAPGNVIVDLFAGEDDPAAEAALAGFDPALALFPGSRASAYADARFLLEVLRRIGAAYPRAGAEVSLAPLLDPARFAAEFRAGGFEVEERDDVRVPLVIRDGDRVLARAWRGGIGALLQRACLVLGQAGTANEAAAAAGVPVVAFERDRDRKTAWYRMRQHGLRGEALAVLPGAPPLAAAGVEALLADPVRRAEMGALGRERMGGPGGALAIARAIAEQLA